ncbi:DUF6404 family protein [Serratia fonticola]
MCFASAAFLALCGACLCGLPPGLMMALYHYWRKRVNKLPDWDSL